MKDPPRFLCFIRLSVTKHQASEWTILSGPLSAEIQVGFELGVSLNKIILFALNNKILKAEHGAR